MGQRQAGQPAVAAGSTPRRRLVAAAEAATASWVSTTPFGVPVEPLVATTRASPRLDRPAAGEGVLVAVAVDEPGRRHGGERRRAGRRRGAGGRAGRRRRRRPTPAGGRRRSAGPPGMASATRSATPGHGTVDPRHEAAPTMLRTHRVGRLRRVPRHPLRDRRGHRQDHDLPARGAQRLPAPDAVRAGRRLQPGPRRRPASA